MAVLISHSLPRDGTKAAGAAAIVMILLAMIIGPLSPIIVLVLVYLGWNVTALFLAIVLFIPLFMNFGESSALCRFLLGVANWFDRPVTLHIEEAVLETMEKEQGSMWCLHPHGTSIGLGFVLNGAIRFKADMPQRYLACEVQKRVSQERLKKISGVQAPILFKVPILSVLLRMFGCCTPATKEDMFRLFQNQYSFGILPGGMEEVALYKKGVDRIYIKKRAGFIKYALQHGYTLVLAYTFGESDLYSNCESMSTINMWMLTKLGFVVPIFWGPHWYCPLLPNRHVQLDTVVGGVIQLPRIDHPTNEEVNCYHQKYITEITKLHSTYKAQFGHADKVLEIH